MGYDVSSMDSNDANINIRNKIGKNVENISVL